MVLGGNKTTKFLKTIKFLLLTTSQLTFYDLRFPTLLSADTFSNDLGEILLQKREDGKLRPVSFISRSLTDTKINYLNIKREREIVIKTDHKLLETSSKELK